jgi:FAD binding domain
MPPELLGWAIGYFSAKANHEELPNHRASNAAGHQTCLLEEEFKQSNERSGPRSVPPKKTEAFYPTHFFICPPKKSPFSQATGGSLHMTSYTKSSDSVDVAIIGSGPYGLSLAAHLGARGVEHRIFGEPMGSWKNNMPSGMLLKSFPWASNLSEPGSEFTVKQFCTERALPYHDELMPLQLSRFIEYAEAFRMRYVPDVERKTLTALEPCAGGFRASFDNGETVDARRVVMAVGLQPFKHLPQEAEHLPADLCSHSGEYGSLERLDDTGHGLAGEWRRACLRYGRADARLQRSRDGDRQAHADAQ